MRRLLLLICVFAALPAWAAENQFDVSASAGMSFDSNVNEEATNSTDSLGFRFGSQFLLSTVANQYEGKIGYSPSAAVYLASTRATKINHVVSADGVYRASKKLRFSLGDDFRLTSDADRDLDGSLLEDLDEDSDKDRIVNFVRLSSAYKFSPRFSGNAILSHNMNLREDKDLSDSHNVGIRLAGNYRPTAKSVVGMGLNARNQFVDASNDVENALRTGFYGFTASYGYQLTPTLRIDLNGGPSWVVTDANNRSLQTKLRGFGSASLAGSWKQMGGALSYARTESTFSSTPNSFISDSLSLTGQRKINRLWRANLRISAVQKKSIQKFNAGDETANFDNNIKQLVTAMTVSRTLGSNLSVSLTVDYLLQSTDEKTSLGDSFSSNSDQVRASISFQYNAKSRRF